MKPRKKAKLAKKSVKSQKNSDIFDVLAKSISDFRTNPLLIVPPLFGYFFTGFVIAFGLIQALLLAILFSDSAFQKYPDPGLIALMGLFVLIDLGILIAISVYLSAAQFGLMADVVSGRKISFSRMLHHGKDFFFPALGLMSAKLIPVFLLFLCWMSFAWLNVNPFLGFPLFLIILLLSVVFYAVLLFGPPILVQKRRSGFFSGVGVVIEAFKYAKSNFVHFTSTLLVVFLLSLASFFVLLGFSIFSYLLPPGIFSGGVNALLYMAELMFIFIISILTMLFIFNSYFSRNKVNWK